MSTLSGDDPGRKPEALVDLREQLYNGREAGPIHLVQLPAALITVLHGIVLDIDRGILLPGPLTPGLEDGPAAFYDQTVSRWLSRHRALAGAEVRDSGRGLHIVVPLDPPVVFETDADRERWAGLVMALQAALPIDPDMPGLTALTRPLGSVNGKTGRPVTLVREGKPTPVAEVLRLVDQLRDAPFRTLAVILLGGESVTPCPICRAEGSSLASLDKVGRCYGSCGTLRPEALYDLFLSPRPSTKEGDANA